MKENYVTLSVADGTEMQAYVARPKAAPQGGIIVFQEAFGVNDYIRRVADRIASEGYLVIAPELFHRTAPGYEKQDPPFEEVMPLIQALTIEGNEQDARAAYEWLSAQEGIGTNIGAVGFCMGGRVTYVANSILPLKAAIALYGSGISDLLDRVPFLAGPMLFFWGGADARIPRETWSAIPAAMDAVGKSHVDVEISGAPHAYLTDDRPSYDQNAASLTWPLMIAFFNEKLA